MSTEIKRLVRALALLAAFAALVCWTVRAQPLRMVSLQGVVVAPHSKWLARCEALPISAVDGIEVVKATVSRSRVAALLRKDNRWGWLQCRRLGVYSGAGVYACDGPTVLRDRMASAPECSHAIPWSSVLSLAPAVRQWIAERSTCCGTATVGGRTYHAWPCAWELEAGRVTVDSRTGVGPGVVGSGSPCEGYEVPE